MAFDVQDTAKTGKKKQIAIIGAGISGLGAAWKLSEIADVTLYEAEKDLGGHARTRFVGPDQSIPVDTGFMVFNNHTYPYLIELFEQLNIESVPTSMSFAVSLDDGAFEYGLTNLKRILADPRNALNPRFWSMITDILMFNKHATRISKTEGMTLGELLNEVGVGEYFRQRYLYPLAGAIWSTARSDMEAFPASSFVQFFENHGLLSATNGPKWRTIVGGSRQYVTRMEQALCDRGVEIKKGAPVLAAGRSPKPWIKTADDQKRDFDEVIFACHANQALDILDDASSAEQGVLGRLRYRPNKVFLHGDVQQMPKRRAAWSSWVYKGGTDGLERDGSFTYWMNSLQHIRQDVPVFVTLNPKKSIREDLIYDEVELWHPQFDVNALKAQTELGAIQGQDHMWFCGAYTRYGFHEDGLASGISIADRLKDQITAIASRV